MNRINLSGEITKIVYKTNKNGDRYALVYLLPFKPSKEELPITLILRGKNVKIAKNGLLEGDSAMFVGKLIHIKKGYFVEVEEIELYSFLRFEDKEDEEYNVEIK